MLEIYAYNAGKGDCIRIRFAEHHNIFIDTGVMGFADGFKSLCDEITRGDEKLEALILTHVDDDHIGGILGNLRRNSYNCPFGEVWMNHHSSYSVGDRQLSVRQNNEVYARLVKLGTNVHPMTKGFVREMAGATIEALWPESTTTDPLQVQQPIVRTDTPLSRHSDYRYSLANLADMPLTKRDTSLNNKNSIIFTFSFENRKLLFTGDAWAEDVVKAKGKYDLIKLPHHGSVRNISEEYKTAFKCSDFLICTDGEAHPDKQTIARLEKWYGEIKVYSPSAWWKHGYFTDGDKKHKIDYIQKEGLVVTW